ncbi:MAG: MOSC domain-containing protein [Anaerolineae bacterium]
MIANPKYLSLAELEAGLEHVRQSPQDGGVLVLIVRRPQTDERESLEQAALDLNEGLVGDNWKVRGSSRTGDGSAHPEMQLTLMNSRLISLIAQEQEHWALAGDQLFVDLDLSVRNVPPGTQLALGSAVIEVTGQPHTGCQKFAGRFGPDALKFINSPLGRQLQLRGINARVVQSGVIRVGDGVKKI